MECYVWSITVWSNHSWGAMYALMLELPFILMMDDINLINTASIKPNS